ncbi:MAG: hypothetical protein GXO10_06620 [Crenarchaeota archaeon]|nr:hypothetical protein [Thermoproteota archaeon]
MLDVIDLGYPEATCHLPLLNAECTVRCFTVGETTSLRTSNTFGVTLINNINETIYNCIQQKPDDLFDDYNKFRKVLPTKDRDALLYSILEASDELKQVIPMTCPNCSNTQELEVNLQDCFDAVLYDGEPGGILNEEEVYTFETPKVIINVTLKVPTLDRERRVLMAVKNIQAVDPLLLSSLYTIHKINFVDKRDNKDLGTIDANNFESLQIFLRRLKLKQLKDIDNHYVETLGRYGLSLKFSYVCNRCNQVNNDIPLDLIQFFFQAIV